MKMIKNPCFFIGGCNGGRRGRRYENCGTRGLGVSYNYRISKQVIGKTIEGL
ncbi:hypothetical protein M0R36_05295 [bacterium]|jgi:hypothetical protein|nr:hypothetical protein [bacterium]